MPSDARIKVSAILPVHNVGGYIGRCIESLQAQTLKELEFIFVDDYISPDFYQLLYAAATEGAGHDIAKGACQKVDCQGADVVPLSRLNARISKHLSQGKPLYTAFTYEHWSAIYRRLLFADDTGSWVQRHLLTTHEGARNASCEAAYYHLAKGSSSACNQEQRETLLAQAKRGHSLKH